MSRVVLSLGSNQGDRHALLDEALRLLSAPKVGQVVQVSSRYETAPMGFESVYRFINLVALLETRLEPLALLEYTQQIERQLGRQHKSYAGQYTDRPIDIDLILYDEIIMDSPRLTLPHPRMHERAFVLEPLMELAPELRHPILGVSIRTLLERNQQ